MIPSILCDFEMPFEGLQKSLSTLQNFEIFEVSSLIFSRHIGHANEGVAMKNWELGCMKPLVMLIWEIPFEKPIRNQFNFLLKVKKKNEYIKCTDSKNKGTMSLSSTLFYLLDYWYHIKNFQKRTGNRSLPDTNVTMVYASLRTPMF